MTAQDLLSQLRAKGVDIRISGDDRLVIDAPRGTVTDDLRTALSANKAALIGLLKEESSAPADDIKTPPAIEPVVPSTPPPPAVPPVQTVAPHPVESSYPMTPPPAVNCSPT